MVPQTEIVDSSPQDDFDDPKPIDWIKILSVQWSFRKLIASVTGIATILAVIVSLLLPEFYRSTTTLLPETEKGKLGMLGGLTDLAALAGVNVGAEGSLAKLYPTIIKSETVLKSVIFNEYEVKGMKGPLNLIRLWDISENSPQREYEAALKKLREELDVLVDNKTSVVTLSIETRDPQLSADILNRVTACLDEFIRTKRITNATEQRKWIEARLGEVEEDLKKSENNLKVFREKNRRVADSPQLLLEQGRFMRDVDINSTLYAELKKQYEIVRIEEIKNIPVISVMDSARPAARKFGPKRSVIVVAAFFISLVGCATSVGIYHLYRGRMLEFFQRIRTGSGGAIDR